VNSGQQWTYRTAADHGLTPVQRLRSVRREPGFISVMMHEITSAVLRTHFRLYNRLTVDGREKLPKKPPFVLISNHQSHIDAVLLAAILPRRAREAAFPVAAGDVFFRSLFTSVLSSLLINALPINRKRVTTHALSELRERLEMGDSGFIIFPEGTRSRDGSMGTFRPGLGMLVCDSPVPVIPCRLVGAFESMPHDAWLPRPYKLTVHVGDPLSFSDLPDSREGWEEVARRTQYAVASLGQK